MPSFLALAVLLAGVDPGAHARAVLDTARLAVAGDSTRAVAARWEARLRRAPDDRAALLGLASLDQMARDHESALRRYQSLHAADSVSPDIWAAYARIGHGLILARQNLEAPSREQLERGREIARALGDRAAEGRALTIVAFRRGNLEGIDAALAALDTAARILPPDAHAMHADRLQRLTILHTMLGDTRARSTAESSLVAARRSGIPGLEAHAIRAIGETFEGAGEDDSALVHYANARAIARRTNEPDLLATILMREASVLRRQGRLEEMRRSLVEARATAEKAGNGLVGAASSVGLAALAVQLRDLPSAHEWLREAETAFRAQGDTVSLETVHVYRGAALLQSGDLDGARRSFQAAHDITAMLGDSTELFENYRHLAAVDAMAGRWSDAERIVGKARAMARKLEKPGWLDLLLGDEARIALLRGDLVAAERLLGRYQAQLDRGDHLQRYDVQARLAEVHARRGELDRAARVLAAAHDDLDRWRATLDDREIRLMAFQATWSEHDDRRSSSARVIAALAAGGKVEAAFELTERRRARELADHLVRAASLASSDAARRTAAAPAVADGAAGERRTSLAPLLDERTALLELVVGTRDVPTTLFVLTRGALHGYALPPEDSVASDVARFVSLLESGADPGPLARALGAALLDPALADLPAAVDRLVVVPDGSLHRLPFEAVRLADGRYLAERFAVSVAPSAEVFALLRAREPRRPGRGADDGVRLLAFGDPAFANEGAASGTPYRDAFEASGGLPRLAASGREARLVARYAADGDVRLRDEANVAELRAASLARYDVLHFATHALVDDRSVARTALALAPSEGSDGFLGVGDLAALGLDADLVVLSACRSAGGVVVGGEGVQGLTAPLLQAGARSIVATQWRIGDESTVRFIEDFYDAMAGGLPVGEALHAAKLAAIGRGAPPGEWAAFTLVGDPLVRIPLHRPAPFSAPWAAVVVTLVLGAAAAGALLYSSRTRIARATERRSVPSSA